MTLEEFDRYCQSLAATTHVVQWGGASVWKVGGKIFALYSRPKQGEPDGAISFKCSHMLYEVLAGEAGYRPAPYLARAKWIQAINANGFADEILKGHIDVAHREILAKLTKKHAGSLVSLTATAT
ncbi:MmcQ/YjbR family DNA-binding protein [Polycladidibacter hongkongensis]|uniref:MmcQ/YjbR family DNA-binding protein n=1 Tax=Polycladidibacter hongkongensis TaxID=1647556 RepID=UPI00082D8E1F|nr:MmcQ/YjbR family DNA-binding protein [Pseudovibrio hongkongensis]